MFFGVNNFPIWVFIYAIDLHLGASDPYIGGYDIYNLVEVLLLHIIQLHINI